MHDAYARLTKVLNDTLSDSLVDAIDADTRDEIQVLPADRDFDHLELRSYRRLARSQACEDTVDHPALTDGGHAFSELPHPGGTAFGACPFATHYCPTHT